MEEKPLNPIEAQLISALGWIENLHSLSREQYLYGVVYPNEPIAALGFVIDRLQDFTPGKASLNPLFDSYHKRDPAFTAATDIVKICEQFVVIFNSEGNPSNSIAAISSPPDSSPEFDLYQAIMRKDTIFQLKDLIDPLLEFRRRSGIIVDNSRDDIGDAQILVEFMTEYEETITLIVRSIFRMLGYEFDADYTEENFDLD